MDTARRGNYNSGEDFVLEYGELRFTFNELDFRERCEQAAVRLGFIGDRLDGPELEDLVNLAVNCEILDPASALGDHVNDCWPEIVGPAERSLVHWLRRLVFRGAWLDQRVREGELDVSYCEDTHSFEYVQPDRGGEPIELAPEPSWGRIAYRHLSGSVGAEPQPAPEVMTVVALEAGRLLEVGAFALRGCVRRLLRGLGVGGLLARGPGLARSARRRSAGRR